MYQAKFQWWFRSTCILYFTATLAKDDIKTVSMKVLLVLVNQWCSYENLFPSNPVRW